MVASTGEVMTGSWALRFFPANASSGSGEESSVPASGIWVEVSDFAVDGSWLGSVWIEPIELTRGALQPNPRNVPARMIEMVAVRPMKP